MPTDSLNVSGSVAFLFSLKVHTWGSVSTAPSPYSSSTRVLSQLSFPRSVRAKWRGALCTAGGLISRRGFVSAGGPARIGRGPPTMYDDYGDYGGYGGGADCGHEETCNEGGTQRFVPGGDLGFPSPCWGVGRLARETLEGGSLPFLEVTKKFGNLKMNRGKSVPTEPHPRGPQGPKKKKPLLGRRCASCVASCWTRTA